VSISIDILLGFGELVEPWFVIKFRTFRIAKTRLHSVDDQLQEMIVVGIAAYVKLQEKLAVDEKKVLTRELDI
jgi:hypothetical protein